MQKSTTTGDGSPPPHVGVCAFPFGTHAAPLLQLTQRIAAAAPHVRFTFFNTHTSNAALFNAINTAAYPNVVPSALPVDAPPGMGGPMAPIEHFLAAAPASVRRGMAAAEAEYGMAISCVVSDAFIWCCGEIAEEKGVPWIPLWTAGPVSLSAHFHTDVLRREFGKVSEATSGDRIADCVSGFSAIRFSDLPSGIVAGDLNSAFSKMLHKMGLMLPKATAVAINSFEELSPTITNDLKSEMRLLSVGPFPLTSPPQTNSDDQYRCLPWLDKQKPHSVAYIAFGTVAAPPQQEIAALAEALGDVRVPCIWSMNDATKVHLPSSFLEQITNDEMLGMIVPWAPQKQILAHAATGVFITHCGWNSIMESIVGGVPLICKPILGDQILNQRWIKFELKFGVEIEGEVITKSSAIKALRQVLSSEDGRLMRGRVKVLKEKAEECIKSGGSSEENFNSLIKIVTSPKEMVVVD